MVDMYIPGFTNMLTQRMARGGRTSRFADADGFMYDPEMGFMSEDMGGPAYVDFTQYVDPQAEAQARAQAEAQARAQAEAQARAQAEAQARAQNAAPPSPARVAEAFGGERDMFIGDAPDRFSQSMNMENYVAPQRDPVTGLLLNAQGQQGFQFMTDRGRQAGFGSGNTGFITADPNAQYRMFDERGRNRIVAEGTGVDALRNIYNTANQFNQEQGRDANWGIERLNPTTGRWERVAENDPAGGGVAGFLGDVALGAGVGLLGAATGGLGLAALPAALGGAAIGGGLNAAGVNVTDVALPVAANFLLPGSGFLGAAAPAALGSAASSALQGRSLEDTLLRSAITAGTAGFLGGTPIGQKITGAVSNFAGDTVNAVLGKVAAENATKEALEEIVVSASRGALPSLLTSGASAGAGSLASQLTNMAPGNGTDYADRVFEQPTTPAVEVPSPLDTVSGDPITITGSRIPTLSPTVPASLASIPGAALVPGDLPQSVIDSVRQEAEPVSENEITVTRSQTPTPSPLEQAAAAAAAAAPVAQTPAPAPEVYDQELTVTDTKQPSPLEQAAAAVAAAAPGAQTPAPKTEVYDQELTVTDTKQPSPLEQAAAAAAAAAAPVAQTPAPKTEVYDQELTVTDTKQPSPLEQAAAAAAAAAAPVAQTPAPKTEVYDQELTVTDTKQPSPLEQGAAAAAAAAPGAQTPAPKTEVYDQELTVTDTKQPSPLEQGAAAAAAAAPGAQTPADVAGEPIIIKMDPNAKAETDAATTASTVAGAIPTGGKIPSGQKPTEGEKTLEDEKSLADHLKSLGISDYLRLAALLAPLLGGGGGRPAPGRIPAGLSSGFAPIFSGGLPRPTLPGATGNFAARNPATLRPQTTQDWYRYGYGPSQSFFDYVPQGAPNTSRAFTGYEQAQAREDKGFYLGGMAGGGDMTGMSNNGFAVNGPGTGRSDQIPALLSDGEYVIDAETVALLGDGSSKAGANRLDQFRINVRKDKGRNLAKGAFSVNAKRPEHYLKGGRA